MHLFRHLLIPFFLLFRFPSIFDSLDSPIPFILLFFFHLPLECLGCGSSFLQLDAFAIGGLAGGGAECGFGCVPVFACGGKVSERMVKLEGREEVVDTILAHSFRGWG